MCVIRNRERSKHRAVACEKRVGDRDCVRLRASPMKTPRPTVDPKVIFDHATAFYTTIDQLHQTSTPEHKQKLAFVLPVLVLSSFASELYFKCLICLESGNLAKGHGLYKLFLKLSAATQRLIESEWDALNRERADALDQLDRSRGQVTSRDLRSNLREGNKGFEQLRYAYEPTGPFTFNLDGLPIALQRAILQLHPEWEVPRYLARS